VGQMSGHVSPRTRGGLGPQFAEHQPGTPFQEMEDRRLGRLYVRSDLRRAFARQFLILGNTSLIWA
jgi:hypothetical protein